MVPALLLLALLGFSIFVTVKGLVQAFKASILLGVVSLFVHPLAVLFGLTSLFGANLPQKLVKELKSIGSK